MAIYDPMLVEAVTRDEILRLLTAYQSFEILFDVLDRVALGLLKVIYPLEETYLWLYREFVPADLYERRNDYFSGRLLQLWFWRRLYEEGDYNAPRNRWPDGNLHPNEHLIEIILSKLRILSFEVAINTWLAVCVEWLQLCNIEEFLKEAKKRRISIIAEQDIPKHMAGMVESVYF